MIALQWFVFIVAGVAMLTALRLAWAWQRLRSHPHVEPVEIAKPSVAEELKRLVAMIADHAGIAPPLLYIRRAAMPNAFVIVAISRPELYLTDELLEHCDSIDNGLEYLTFTICHEIAHIRRGDSIRLGLLTYASQWANLLGLHKLEKIVRKKIEAIEQQTDMEAERLVHHVNCKDSTTNTSEK